MMSGLGATVGGAVGTAVGGPIGTAVGTAVGAGVEWLVGELSGLFSGSSKQKEAEIKAASEAHKKWLEGVIAAAENYEDFGAWILWNYVFLREQGRAWPTGMKDGSRGRFLEERRREWIAQVQKLIETRGEELRRQFEAERARVKGGGESKGGGALLPLLVLGALALSRA